MDSLTELYNQQIVPMDEELEKQATEMWKEAEEEDAAGRIMARGFADELDKLAGPQLSGKDVNFSNEQGSTITAGKPSAAKKKAIAGAGKAGILGSLGKQPFKSLGGAGTFGAKKPAAAKAPAPAPIKPTL
jgi:hypothetical protein